MFTTPTPGAANAGAAAEYVTRPVLSPAAGVYAGAQNVTITGPAGATIRYTTDGSMPTAASTVYARSDPRGHHHRGPCRRPSRAAGAQPSFTETNTYLIGTNHRSPC